MGLGSMRFRAFKWAIWFIVMATWIGPVRLTSTSSSQTLPKHSFDNYSVALNKAMLFFNAQKCKSISSPTFLLLLCECLYYTLCSM